MKSKQPCLIVSVRSSSERDDSKLMTTTVKLNGYANKTTDSQFQYKNPHRTMSVAMANNILNLTLRDADIVIRLTQSPEPPSVGNRAKRDVDIFLGVPKTAAELFLISSGDSIGASSADLIMPSYRCETAYLLEDYFLFVITIQ
jgi:hypothetical protein